MSNTAYRVCLHSGTSAGPQAGVDSEDAGTMKVNEGHGVTQKTSEPATSDGVYNDPTVVELNDTLELKQNDAYALEEPVTTSTKFNESYNYPAKFDPSNAIEAKPNKAYAINITTGKNEAYKPVVSASGTYYDEYDYIYIGHI